MATVDAFPPQSRDTTEADCRRGVRVDRTVVITVAVTELAILYALFNRGGWLFDDNLYLELARASGTSWHWLMSNIFGHWAIGDRAAVSIQNHLMPLDYRWALIAMLAALGAAVYLLDRISRLLLPGRWIPVVVAGYFGMSILLVRPLQWWSSGIQSFPTVVGDLACLYGYLRYQRERSARWIIVGAAGLAGSLLFYEKSLYMFLYLPLLRVSTFPGKLRLRNVVKALWSERPFWFTMGGVALLWALVFVISRTDRFFAPAAGPSTSSFVGLSEWLHYGRVLWAQTLVPAIFGVSLPAARLSNLEVAGAVACQIALAIVVALSIAGRRTAWRAWAALGICVVATAVLVGRARLAQFGAEFVGSDTRYLLDFSWLVPLFVGIAFTSGPLQERTGFTRRFQYADIPRGARVIGTLLVGAYLAACLGTDAKLQRQWPGHTARGWETNVQAGIGGLRQSGRQPVLANNVVPWYIVRSMFAPWNELSDVVPHYAPGIQIDGPVDGRILVRLGSDGRPHQADVGRVVTRWRSANGSCKFWSVASQIKGGLLQGPSFERAQYYALVSYKSFQRGEVPFLVEHGRGLNAGGLEARSLLVARGTHESILWLGTGSPRGFILKLPPRTVCVREVDTVTLSGR